jgi:hypothetical protein
MRNSVLDIRCISTMAETCEQVFEFDEPGVVVLCRYAEPGQCQRKNKRLH